MNTHKKQTSASSSFLSNGLRLLGAAVVLGVLSPVQAAPATKPTVDNLVINGDLEKPNATNDYAAGWFKSKAGKCSWLAEEGDHFIRLEALEPNQMTSIYNQVPLHGAKAVELTVRVRVTGLVRGAQPWFDARMMTKFCDAGGAEIKGAKAVAFGKNTDGWVEKKIVMNVPEGAVFLAIMPTLLNVDAGTMDFSAVTLLAVEPTPAVAPTP